MGKSLDELLKDVVPGGGVEVTLVTNQDNGIASYAVGALIYHPAGPVGPIFRAPRLSTTGGDPLRYFFSDRMLDIDPPGGAGSFGHTPRQPFSANATDKLGLSVSIGLGPHILKLTLHSWGDATLTVAMEPKGDMLVGVGPPIGNQTTHAVYVVSFGRVFRPTHIG